MFCFSYYWALPPGSIAQVSCTMLGGVFIGGCKAEAEAEATLAAALQQAGFVVVVPELPGADVNGGDSATTVSLERECANFSHCYNASLFSLRVAAVSARCVVQL
eukprot:COSAG01_NODE_1467_length_10217_cov_33.824570_13_plen_105_part_00